MITPDLVLDALTHVRDPEIDEPLPALGFVSALHVDGSAVRVCLRLPTYFCAPGFAYMMVADARRAVLGLAGVREVTVVLEDHFGSAEINAAVAGGAGLEGAFPGETAGDLNELRALFTRKALAARQARLCDALLRTGRALGELAAMRLAALDDHPDVDRCRALRRELGLDASPGAPAFLLPDGRAPGPDELGRYLRVARTIRVSLEGNAGLCRTLLRTRYGIPDPEEAAA